MKCIEGIDSLQIFIYLIKTILNNWNNMLVKLVTGYSLGASNECHSDGQFPLHSSGQVFGHLMPLVWQSQVHNHFIGLLLDLILGPPLDASVEPEVLLHGQPVTVSC